ncbi:hypothetical protein L8V01_02565 [Corynebacterium sp. c8Ua_181]|jgi:hypothetical protein|uniref:SPOR domain-containing protein n=1 Tax=Corynebacterium curieae TaxID=2913500 RepID=A0A9X3M8W5_9CORY|nr:hypothetical protein [Corynebacterium curieae]MCZ9306372.1 hypothetical protein [Corynebacterium curieae]MDV2423137.1 hypothetical protein [Corynebacterium curieae]
MSDADQKWFFDPATKEVSQGKASGWENRMGPYDTREEAENAIEIAQARNDAADAADEEDDWK